MEEELITYNKKEEIKISKYGKKKKFINKKIFKIKKYSIIFLILSLSLIFIFFNFKNLIQRNILSKEENSKNKKINEISEKDRLNEIALKEKLIPYPMIQYFLQRKNFALVNIFKLTKIKREDININQLLYALNKTIYNHPVLLSRFHKNEKGEIFMEYRPDLPPEIKIINIKDEDIPNLKDKILHKFDPFDSFMVNFTLFISNTSIYFFYDIFHSNCDGNSVTIFENNLELAYMNKTLPKDYYYLNLYEYNKEIFGTKYNETVKFYQENFNLSREYCPKFDNDIPEEIKNNKNLQLIYKEYSSNELREQLTKNFGKKIRNYNIFMIMNILLTDYIYSNYEDEYPTAKIGFNGRNWEKDENSVGCLIYNFPVIYHFQNKQVNIKKFYNKIKELFEMKPKLMKYPFEHTEKYTSMMAIMQTKNFYHETFLGKKFEIIYGYNNLLNMKSEFVMSPIMQELFIDNDNAKYSYFFD